MSDFARSGAWSVATGASLFASCFAVGVSILCLVTLPVLHLAANRLVVGTPVMAAAAFGSPGWLAVAFWVLGGMAAVASRSRLLAVVALLAFSMGLVLFAVDLGLAASDLVAGQPSSARARLAAGAWTTLLLFTCAIAWSARRTRLRGVGWLNLAGMATLFALLFDRGTFDGLSLVVEYRARAASVHAAFVQHLALAATATLLAAFVCTLLYAWRYGRGAVEIALNGIQVVPAVALLGGLVALLSGLLEILPSLRSAGLSALGTGPAVLAIAAYLLLPFWHGLRAALRAPDPSVIDAAVAMGLRGDQILLRVRLPLGAPLLIGGLRVACVQSIGLTTLGALVGAGGLGGIVFDGMAQFAADLILIGALPVIGLSLIVERILSSVERRVRSRWSA